MSDTGNPDENEFEGETEKVQEVYDMKDDADSAGLPDIDFLGLTPGDANEETKPGDPLVPDQG